METTNKETVLCITEIEEKSPQEPNTMRILGVAQNFNNDGKLYYIAQDDKGSYFLFLGSECANPSDIFGCPE